MMSARWMGVRTASGSDRISHNSPMKRDYIDFQDRSSPVGFLITFRCYGTWLHGDERGSVDRHHRTYGTPGLQPSALRRQHDRDLLKQPPVKLDSRQRPIVESA